MKMNNHLIPLDQKGPALADGTLSPEELLLFQAKLWELLRLQTARLTSDESSSVPVETAERLLSSLCFTLREPAKEFSSPAPVAPRRFGGGAGAGASAAQGNAVRRKGALAGGAHQFA